jgi:hypothetical protein
VISVWIDVLHTFHSFRFTISFVLVVIGHVREVRYTVQGSFNGKPEFFFTEYLLRTLK